MDSLENRSTYSPNRVIVVGGGWAGLSCAYALTRWGYPVTLLEAAPQWGGRARTIQWASLGLALDNGQHILLGAYEQFLHILRELGQDTKPLFQRVPLGFRIETANRVCEFQSQAKWPAPWNLVMGFMKAKGWTLGEKWRLLKILRRIRGLNASDYVDQTVLTFLQTQGQTETLIETFWSPLLLAALSTPLKEASAFYAIRVLQDSFSGKKGHSDLLIPLKPLGELLPEPMVAFLEEQGQVLGCHQRVQSLLFDETGSTCLGVKTKEATFRGRVVLALPHRSMNFAHGTQTLQETLVKQPQDIAYQPILTIYYAFEFPPVLPSPLLAIIKQYHYWVFQKHYDAHVNVLAVVLSGEGAHTTETKDEVMDHIQHELQDRFPGMGKLIDRKYIQEKYAAFSCHSDHASARITQDQYVTPISQLWQCGDETHHDYPSTLEGAIQSGLGCAQAIWQTDRSMEWMGN